jgi:hypothetical protein
MDQPFKSRYIQARRIPCQVATPPTPALPSLLALVLAWLASSALAWWMGSTGLTGDWSAFPWWGSGVAAWLLAWALGHRMERLSAHPRFSARRRA